MTTGKTNFPFTLTKAKTLAEFIFMVGTPVGLACIYFLGSQFATKEELKEQSDRTTRIETTIAVMVEQNRVNEWQNDLLADHEARLRTLEMAKK